MNDSLSELGGNERRRGRTIVLALLLMGVLIAALWLFGTEAGRQHLDRENLRHLGLSVRGWVDRNPLLTYAGFLLCYVICALTLLPVWWLQMIAGFAFGLWPGLGWVMLASTCGALATAQVSRWLGEEWVHHKIVGKGKRAKRMRRIIALFGRNGLLVVLISRLSYPVPYGVSNYLFGLLGIRNRQIILGTALGGIPRRARSLPRGHRSCDNGDRRKACQRGRDAR